METLNIRIVATTPKYTVCIVENERTGDVEGFRLIPINKACTGEKTKSIDFKLLEAASYIINKAVEDNEPLPVANLKYVLGLLEV